MFDNAYSCIVTVHTFSIVHVCGGPPIIELC